MVCVRIALLAGCCAAVTSTVNQRESCPSSELTLEDQVSFLQTNIGAHRRERASASGQTIAQLQKRIDDLNSMLLNRRQCSTFAGEIVALDKEPQSKIETMDYANEEH